MSGNKTPVLILGGLQNTLSLTRSLGVHGIDVAVSEDEDCCAKRSRFCKHFLRTPSGEQQKTFWEDLLLGKDKSGFNGCMLFTGSDSGIEFLAKNKEALSKHYLMDDFDPTIHLNMLDKRKTVELARLAGVGVPNSWQINCYDDIYKSRDELSFPIIIKPIFSHKFQRVFSGKYFLARNFSEVEQHVQEALNNNVEVMLTEMIVGADNNAMGFYAYYDNSGQSLFNFTLRVIRRFPMNQGPGTYFISSWNQELADIGSKFFKYVNYRGMGQIEFKRDLKDGQFKLIECNPRYTVAQELLYRSGVNNPYMIYNHVLGNEVPKITSYKQNVSCISSSDDFYAFLELRKKKMITFYQWVRSIARIHTFIYFKWSDPWPASYRVLKYFWHQISKRLLRIKSNSFSQNTKSKV